MTDTSTRETNSNSSATSTRRFALAFTGLGRTDVLVCALIISLGAFQFFLSARETDFRGDDVFFADSGRSLIERGFYGINGYPETNMPPALPAMLGILGVFWGYSPTVFLRTMAIFGTLGFLASYELLRRQMPRLVAAAICLLLMSSETYFWLATSMVCPSYPYMFTTLGALLISRKLEEATSLALRFTWGVLFAVLVVVSLLFASAAMAFFGAMLAGSLAAFFWNRSLALRRLKIYLPVLIVGLVVQGLWTHKGHVEASAGISAAEWPLPGFPRSYLAQLKVKSGNDPELGLATPGDVAVRVFENACAQCDLLSRMLMRELPPVNWTSIFVAVPLLLIAVGWCASVWRSKGGLQEWYFAAYEFIYLLWPWNLEPRFLMPITPLACLFLWRGANAVVLSVRNNSRAISIVSLPVTIILAICAWLDLHGAPKSSQHRFLELQDELSFVVWLALAGLMAWTIWPNAPWFRPISAVAQLLHRLVEFLQIKSHRSLRNIAVLLVAGLFLFGLTLQLGDGFTNLVPVSLKDSPDAGAGMWIRDHTDGDAVIMARHVPTMYHYSGRKVVWFPPSSDPQLLMEGIARHQVDFVVVAHRENPYYLPADDISFASLFTAYRNAFRLVCEGPGFRIFRVITNQFSLGKFGFQGVQ